MTDDALPIDPLNILETVELAAARRDLREFLFHDYSSQPLSLQEIHAILDRGRCEKCGHLGVLHSYRQVRGRDRWSCCDVCGCEG